jgi:Fe2+ or Zn2+ uptake regulation protein
MRRKLGPSIIALNNEVKNALHVIITPQPRTSVEIQEDLESLARNSSWIPSVPTVYDYMRLFEKLGIVESTQPEETQKKDRGIAHRTKMIKSTQFSLVDESLRLPAFFSLEQAVNSGESLFSFFGTNNLDENTGIRLEIMLNISDTHAIKINPLARMLEQKERLVYGNVQQLMENGYIHRIGNKNGAEMFEVVNRMTFPLYWQLLADSYKAIYELHAAGLINNASIKEMCSHLAKKGYNVRRDVLTERLLDAMIFGGIKKKLVGKEYCYTSTRSMPKFLDSHLALVPGYTTFARIAGNTLTPNGKLQYFTKNDLAPYFGSSETAKHYIKRMLDWNMARKVAIGYQRTEKGNDFTRNYLDPLMRFFNGYIGLSDVAERMQSITREQLSIMISAALTNYWKVSPYNNGTSTEAKQKRILQYLRENGPSFRVDILNDIGTGDFDTVARNLLSQGVISSTRVSQKSLYSLSD